MKVFYGMAMNSSWQGGSDVHRERAIFVQIQRCSNDESHSRSQDMV